MCLWCVPVNLGALKKYDVEFLCLISQTLLGMEGLSPRTLFSISRTNWKCLFGVFLQTAWWCCKTIMNQWSLPHIFPISSQTSLVRLWVFFPAYLILKCSITTMEKNRSTFCGWVGQTLWVSTACGLGVEEGGGRESQTLPHLSGLYYSQFPHSSSSPKD